MLQYCYLFFFIYNAVLPTSADNNIMSSPKNCLFDDILIVDIVRFTKLKFNKQSNLIVID